MKSEFEVSTSRGNDRYDKTLGMNQQICRRDFLDSTLLASGSLLLESLTPEQLLGRDDWTGYGGVGDYADSNGNTLEVMRAGHQLRDHVFDSPPEGTIDTGELLDCVIVGGGISGLAAALFLTKQGGPKLRSLILENHPIFGGEAKRNEFIVDGKRLMGPQGSDHFQAPYAHSFTANFYDLIGLDCSEFRYQTWASSSPEIPLGVSFEDTRGPIGFYFGANFGRRPGMWLIDPWAKKFNGAPIPDSTRAELLNYAERRRGRGGLPFDYPGDEKSRKLDSMTIEEHLIQEYGLSRATIRTFFIDEGSGHGAGPDVLSAYAPYSWAAESPESEHSNAQVHSFPGGNTGIGRLLVKTLIPHAISGPRRLPAVCRNHVDFAALDRAGQTTRIRLAATVVGVEHEGDPNTSDSVRVIYARHGKVYRLKARSVVMAGGSWTTKYAVRDLPSAQREAYEQFYRSPCLVANVAVRNWRFLYKLGISGAQWFEGFGSATAVRKVPTFSTDDKTIGPDSPVVLSLKVLFHHPGLPLEQQGNRGRTELLSTSFRDYERKIREQLTEMFSASGFDAQRDIAGIILNRWGHAYVSPQPGFFFGKGGKPAPREILRRAPFGRIAFANTDLSGAPDHTTAIKEAHRAVGQILQGRQIP
jgi:spermidine dehydrogenase